MMIGYDIYDRFTMEHFRLRQSMILTTSFFCSRQYITFIPYDIRRKYVTKRIWDKFQNSPNMYSITQDMANLPPFRLKSRKQTTLERRIPHATIFQI
jgi:hypothetical protein